MKYIFLIFILFFSSALTAMDQSICKPFPKEIWNIIFAYTNFKSKHYLMRVCKLFTSEENKKNILDNICCSNDLGLTFNEFINGLFFFKNNETTFSYLTEKALPVHKNDLEIYFNENYSQENGDKTLYNKFSSKCTYIINSGNNAEVKFYTPYSSANACVDSLRNFIRGDDNEDKQISAGLLLINEFNEYKNILEEICNFFNMECTAISLVAIITVLKESTIQDKEDCLSDALKQGCFPAVVLLMSYMEGFNSIDSTTQQNRLYSARNDKERLLLAQAGCSFLTKDPLCCAIKDQNRDLVSSLLEIILKSGRTTCLSLSNSYRKLPLIVALEHGSDDILKALIKAGAQLHLKEHNLHDVLKQTNIQRLVECGYDINSVIDYNNNKLTFLLYAVKQNNQELVKWLLKKDVRVDIFSMIYSLKNDVLKEILLTQKNISIYNFDDFGSEQKNLLIQELKNTNENLLISLLEKGYFLNENLSIVVNIALECNMVKLVEEIVSQQKNYFSIDHLCKAISNECVEITKILLNTGININARDTNFNEKPIYYCNRHNPKMMTILFSAGATIYDINSVYYNTIIESADQDCIKSIINSLHICHVDNETRKIKNDSLFYQAIQYNNELLAEELVSNHHVTVNAEQFFNICRKSIGIAKILFNNNNTNVMDIYPCHLKKIISNVEEDCLIKSLEKNKKNNEIRKEYAGILNNLFMITIQLVTVGQKKEKLIDTLLLHGADINKALKCFINGFKENINGINHLLYKGANICSLEKYYYSWVLKNAYEDAIVQSLKNNFNSNKNNKKALNTLLLHAIYNKKSRVARALVACGANINASLDIFDSLCTLKNRHKSIFEYAQEKGVDIRPSKMITTKSLENIKSIDIKSVSIKKIDCLDPVFDISLRDLKRETWMVDILKKNISLYRMNNNKLYIMPMPHYNNSVDEEVIVGYISKTPTLLDIEWTSDKKDVSTNSEHKWHYQSFIDKNLDHDIQYIYSKNITKQRMLLLNRE
ncbi:MAG TPA: hypothetical protein VLB80_04205 [Candidatus Babeliales bacterium]|nr:hypothetical protein [Candidatus Babeliales bacterium]